MNEPIGYCEGCGCLDHHRINGLCAQCFQKTKTIPAAATEPPVGYEAANTETISNYRGSQHARRD